VGSLIPSGGDAPTAKCAHCPRAAVGPCARCRRNVCGDCCELVAGGAGTFAVCLRCAKGGGATIGHAWRELFGWLALVILGMIAIVVVIVLARRA